jgi:hypothetical protein
VVMVKVNSERNPENEPNSTKQKSWNWIYLEIYFLKRGAVNLIHVYRRFRGTCCRSSGTSGKLSTWQYGITHRITIFFITTALRTPNFPLRFCNYR